MKHKLIKTLLIALSINSLISSAAFAELKAVYTTDDAYVIASNVSYDYHEGCLYSVNTQIGYATDIALHPGEKLVGVISGDTKQWAIDNANVGGTTHVYIKPLVSDITTDMVINTDKRSYRLLVTSTDTYNPLITFTFSEEMYAKLAKTTVYRDRAEKDFLDIFTEQKDGQFVQKKINYKYTIKASKNLDPDLCPLKTLDDNTRTYIQMPVNRYDLPVLYNVDDTAKNKLTLVNYRVKGQYFIADRVFKHARLQYSSKLFVDILPRKDGDTE